MDFLPILPAEILSQLAPESGEVLAPLPLGAAGLLPRGSPGGVGFESNAEPLDFAGLLLAVELPAAPGMSLPVDGKILPSAPTLVPPLPFLPTDEPFVMLRGSQAGVVRSGEGSAQGPPAEAIPVDRLQGLAEGLSPPVLSRARPELSGDVATTRDPLQLALRAEPMAANPPPLPGPLTQARGGERDAQRATRPIPAPSPTDGLAEIELVDPSRWTATALRDRLNLEQPIKLPVGGAEGPLQDALPTLPRTASPAVVADPSGIIPATAAPTTMTSVGSVESAGLPLASTAAEARWSEALAGRVNWMIDQKLGEARIKLNPPELGALDIKISMVEEKAYVQMTASQSAARELLESALPRLRELLTAGGLELANATVGGGPSEHRSAASPLSQPLAETPGAEPQEPVTTHLPGLHTGRIDLYA